MSLLKKMLLHNWKQFLCFGIFLFINALFARKYFCRYTDFYFIATGLNCLALILIYAAPIDKWNSKFFAFFNYFLIAVYFLFGLLVLQIIDIQSLQVDRWSVITSFWENFEKGEYVYYAQSFHGNYPGPMPFYYILAYPFYLAGELGYFSLLGVPLLFLLLKYCKTDIKHQTKILLLLFCSPFVWWEISSRSNILLNSVLILFSTVYFFNDFPKITTKRLVIAGILLGLLLSTRNVFAIVYITACIFALKSGYTSFKQMVLMSILAAGAFVGTFVPFVWGHWSDFWVMNPFIIQGSVLMPFAYTLIFIVLAFIFGIICRKTSDVYFYSSLNLFLCILTYGLYHICRVGYFNVGLTDYSTFHIDISYFILCIPFTLLFSFRNDKKQQSHCGNASLQCRKDLGTNLQ